MNNNICILEDTAAELEKAKALVTLIQSGTDDYASIDVPFKSCVTVHAGNGRPDCREKLRNRAG